MNDEQLNLVFSALANTNRRAILMQLSQGEATVNELAASFDDISLPGISKHIKVLEKSGLIERSAKAQYRPCNINEETVTNLSTWIEEMIKLWTMRFDQLDNYIQEFESKEENNEK